MNRITLLLLLISSVCFGQEDFSDLSLEDLLNVKVSSASVSEESVSDAPGTIFVITAEEIEARGYEYLYEALEDLPEVEIQSKSSRQSSNIISLRGVVGNDKFLIMVDGIRMNSMAGSVHAVEYGYPIANVKQVEVIIGPVSAIYGADAFAGVINIISYTGKEIKGGTASYSYGSFNTQNASLITGVGNEDLSFTLNMGFHSSREAQMYNYFPEEFDWYINRYSQDGGLLANPFTPGVELFQEIKPFAAPTAGNFIHGKLNVKNFEVGVMRSSQTHSSSTAFRPEYSIYSADTKFGAIVQQIYARHNWVSNLEKWSIQTYLSRGQFEVPSSSKFINTFTAYRDGYKYARHSSGRLNLLIQFKPNDYNTFTFSPSVEQIEGLPETGDLPFQFNTSVPSELQNQFYLGTNIKDVDGNDLTVPQKYFFFQQQNYGIFGQYELNIKDKLKINAGIRYDFNTRYGPSVNPRLGLVFDAFKGMKIKALYSEAFLAPSTKNTFDHFGSFVPVLNADSEVIGLEGGFWHLPNIELDPSKIRNVEMNFRYINGPLSFAVNGYYMTLTDVIKQKVFLGQSFAGIPISEAEISVNSGVQSNIGGSAKFDFRKKIGKTTLSAYGIYSYSDGNLDGNPLPLSARHTVKAGLYFSYGFFSLNVRGIRRTASFNRGVIDDDGVFTNQGNEAYYVGNIFARFNVIKKDRFNMALFAKVTNFTNNKYYNVSVENEGGFVQTPQDPIRFNFGLELGFQRKE